jgi:hypothetical protein
MALDIASYSLPIASELIEIWPRVQLKVSLIASRKRACEKARAGGCKFIAIFAVDAHVAAQLPSLAEPSTVSPVSRPQGRTSSKNATPS